jgi:plasmid stabilization system protein ParE
VTEYRLVSDPRADLDIESAFHWYEKEQSDLGLQFLDELRGAYNRIVENPLKYPHLRSGVRRALLKRFPYVVYFAVESPVVVVLAVLHASRSPAEWQRRIG